MSRVPGFRDHILVYHSTLGVRAMKKKKKSSGCREQLVYSLHLELFFCINLTPRVE